MCLVKNFELSSWFEMHEEENLELLKLEVSLHPHCDKLIHMGGEDPIAGKLKHGSKNRKKKIKTKTLER